MGQRQPSTLLVTAEAPPFRVSWDGRDIAGEYRDHRFSASFQETDAKGHWLLWHYWPAMPRDAQGFAVHPTVAPNGRRCTGFYRSLEDVTNAVRAILASIDHPNVIAFRPKALQPARPAARSDGPLVA